MVSTTQIYDAFEFSIHSRAMRTFTQKNSQDSQILQSMRDGYSRLSTTEAILNLGAEIMGKHCSTGECTAATTKRAGELLFGSA